MPFFLTLAPNIWDHAVLAFQSAPFEVSFIGVTMPKTIVYLIGNVFTQYPFSRTEYFFAT